MEKETLYQLAMDYYFWRGRFYYREIMEKYLANEISSVELINELLLASLGNVDGGQDLRSDPRLQAAITFDPQSFKFSDIIRDLIPSLEGFNVDDDPEDAIVTEDQLKKCVSVCLRRIEEYLND